MGTIRDICRICLQESCYHEVQQLDLRKLGNLINKYTFLPKWHIELFRKHLICNTCIDNFRTIESIAKNANKANTAIFCEMKRLHLRRVNLKRLKRFGNIHGDFIICRLCLEPTRKIAVYLYDNPRNILPMEYVDKMLKSSKIYTNFDRTINPILCPHCWETVQVSYSFRKQIETVSEKIYWYRALTHKSYINREDLQEVKEMWESLGVCKVEEDLKTPDKKISEPVTPKSLSEIMTPKGISELATPKSRQLSKIVKTYKKLNIFENFTCLDEHNYFKRNVCDGNDDTLNRSEPKAKPNIELNKKVVKEKDVDISETSFQKDDDVEDDDDVSSVVEHSSHNDDKTNGDNVESYDLTSEVQIKKELEEEEEVEIKREILSNSESDQDDCFIESCNDKSVESEDNNDEGENDECPNLVSFIKSEPPDNDLYDNEMDVDEPPELEFQGPCINFTIQNTFTVDEKRSLLHPNNPLEEKRDVPSKNALVQNSEKPEEKKNTAPKTPLLRVKRNLFHGEDLLEVKKEVFIKNDEFQIKNLVVNITKCDEAKKELQEPTKKERDSKPRGVKKVKNSCAKSIVEIKEEKQKDSLFKCDICDFETITRIGALRHVTAHKLSKIALHSCKCCSYKTSNIRNFLNHEKMAHTVEKKKILTKIKEKSKLPLCEFCFKSLRNKVHCIKCDRFLHPSCFKKSAIQLYFQCFHDLGDVHNKLAIEIRKDLAATLKLQNQSRGHSGTACNEEKMSLLRKKLTPPKLRKYDANDQKKDCFKEVSKEMKQELIDSVNLP